MKYSLHRAVEGPNTNNRIGYNVTEYEGGMQCQMGAGAVPCRALLASQSTERL